MGGFLNRKNLARVQRYGRHKIFGRFLKVMLMAKRFKLCGIRIHQSYKVGEVVELLGASEQTVRRWILKGLPVLNSMRPMLILGFELKSYLEGLQAKPKCEASMGAIMCMSCRKRQMPLGLMADCIATTDNNGLLVALCSECEGDCVLHKILLSTFGGDC